MKKVYINCPVIGREYIEVDKTWRKMKAIAEAIIGDDVEVVNEKLINEQYSMIGLPVSAMTMNANAGLSMVAEALLKAAEADYVVLMDHTPNIGIIQDISHIIEDVYRRCEEYRNVIRIVPGHVMNDLDELYKSDGRRGPACR